ncbi:MAG TPA: hypothetical protein VKI44_13680 [Acetobacteraceae bacterium]|nr:hypothetical protein [Acetobacteraceae bacterium]
MSEYLLSARRGAEYYNLRLMQGFVVLGIMTGAIATGLAVAFSGGQLGTEVGRAAALGQAALLAGMALTCAALVGFLFAVPRARADAQRADSTAQSLTNLEQISDWLTKGLVGAALVSVNRLPDIVNQLQDFAAIGDHSSWGARMGLLVTLYFAMMGFIGGYLLSRLQFITILDRAPFVITALEALQQVPIRPEGAQRTNLSLDELNAVESFSRVPVSQLHRGHERRQWAKAQMVAGSGDLKAAVRVYDDLLKVDPDPQITIERSIALRRLDVSSAPAQAPSATESAMTAGMSTLGRIITLGHLGVSKGPKLPPPVAAASAESSEPSSSESSEPSSLELPSAQAAVNQMFVSLYDPPPAGFEKVIRIGEELVPRVRDSSVWAYLACAYGQKYRHLLEPGANVAELDPVRERALFSVKQALDLDATKWRTTLRALWDRNAVRLGGDDDLVVFSGDPQFAALLDPDSVKVAAGDRAGLASQRLVQYCGAAQIWLVDAQGAILGGERPQLRPGLPYRLFVRLVPENVKPSDPAPGGIVQEVRITEGDDRPRIEFEFRPDGIEMRFSPERSAITASLSAATAECGFDFRVPLLRAAKPEERDIYVEIAQGRRIVLTVPVKVSIAPTNV